MSDEGVIVPPGGKPMPTNEARLEGSVSPETGAEIHGSIEHEHGNVSAGVEGGLSQKKGWAVSGFVRWIFGGK